MTKKLRYFCTLLLMAVVSVAWADQESVTFADEGYTNGQEVASYTGTNFSIAFNKGTNSNAPKYYTTGSAIRAYGGNNFTVSSDNTITGITITFASGEGPNAITTDVETYSNGTWSGSANSVTFTVGGTTGHRRIAGISVTYTASGSSTTLEDNDLALTGAPVALTFDLYDNAEPQVINFTTSSTGAVTIPASNFFETAIDETNKTITVTPVAVTNGVKEATVNQAADETYKAGSATFTVDITDSTPFSGGDVTFVGGTDRGTSTDSNNGDEVSKQCVTISSTKAAFNYSEYRIYSGSTTTISTTQGTITKIVFTKNGNYSLANLSTSTGTYDSSTGIWTGDAQSVSFSASAQVRLNQIDVTVTMPGDDPYISANNVNIAYDATSGEIAYTINNPVPGTLLQATADADWVSDITVGDEAITFTTTANEANTERVATFTLTYEGAEDKTVTVTQAAAPVVYTTIPDLFAAATSTATDVNVTFDGWVVTGVSTNGKNVFVTDGQGNGFVINGTDLGNDYAVGNTLTGSAVACSLKLQNGYAQLSNVDANDLTIGTGGSIDFSEIAMADLAGVNTGALVSYENLTCSVDNNRYYLTDGTTTVQVYSSLYADAYSTLEEGKTYNIAGVYQQYNNTKEILPRSTEDIVEVVSEEPSITVSPAEVNATAEETDGTLAISYENLEISDVTDFEVQYYDVTGAPISSEPEWVAVEVTVGTAGYEVSYIIENNTNSEERTAYFKVMALDNDANEVYSNLVTVTQEGFSSTGSFTFVQTSATAGTLTNEPEGVTAVFNNTYTNNKEQLTKDNSMTLTIKGMPANYKVTGITLTVKNNASKGSGTATVSIGKKEIGTLDVTGLGGTYGDQDVTIIPSFATSDLVINIAATENSVYCKKFTIEYEIMDYVGVTIKEGFTATTFSCNKALDFTNADVTAQIITDEVGTTQTVTVVPAETGLYITGEPGIHEIPVADASAKTDNVDSNKLKAVMEDSQFATQNSVTFYAFGKQKGKEAFYKIPTSGYNVPAGKAVLRITKANAPEMIVVNGGTTAIDNSQLTIDSLDGEWFDLSGRKLSNGQIQKGIYIVGGCKVVVK